MQSSTDQAAAAAIASVERRLRCVCRTLVAAARPAAGEVQCAVARAMRYALLSGGKRIRPAICLATHDAAAACGMRRGWSAALDAAVACEMLHTASLVLDDLPCMDDATLRRAKPCTHVKFGEATAILAADTMVAAAMQVALGTLPGSRRRRRRRRRRRQKTPWDGGRRATVLDVLLEACERMAHGQMLDLFFGASIKQKVNVKDVVAVHAGKTGALIAAAAVAGAVCAGGGAVDAARRYGDSLGLAFQIMDDMLDATQTEGTTGKTTGRDIAAGKPSYVAAAGIVNSMAEVERLVHSAISAAASSRLACIAHTVLHAAARTTGGGGKKKLH
jgi:geranylgeranyl pyrophosphate synthase